MQEPGARWPVFHQVYRRQALMDSVMETTAVDLVAAVRAERGQAFFAARSKCRLCPHEQECREWVATARPGRPAPEFCPNSQFFDACRTKKVPLSVG
jgi:hypothetical protein